MLVGERVIQGLLLSLSVCIKPCAYRKPLFLSGFGVIHGGLEGWGSSELSGHLP